MNKLRIKHVVVKRNQNRFDLDFVIVCDSKLIAYQKRQFRSHDIGTTQIDLDDYETVFDFSETTCYLSEIREHDELDNYFIMLSDRSILRINITEANGSIREELTYHEFDAAADSYYSRLVRWFNESSILRETKGLWS